MALASTAVALALGELGARVWSDEVYLQIPLHRGGLLLPFVSGAEADLVTEEFRAPYQINRFGFRDRLDRRVERDGSRARVLLLGDSVAAGWGVAFPETFGARLEEELGVEVVNAAANGGCPLWYIHQMREHVPRFRPDGLLVQVFDNDPADNHQFSDALGARPGERVGKLPVKASRPEGIRRLRAALATRSVLFQRFRRLRGWRAGHPLTRQPYLRRGSRPELGHLSRAEATARHPAGPGEPQYSEPFTFYVKDNAPAWEGRLQFHGQLLDQLLAEIDALGLSVIVVYVPIYQPFLARRPPEQLTATNPHARILREVCGNHGVTFVDGVLVLGADPEPERLYYVWDGHLDAEGHAVLARALDDPVRRLVARGERQRRP